MFHSFFHFSGKIQVFVYLFTFLSFLLCGPLELQNPWNDNFFLSINIMSSFLAGILGDPLGSLDKKEFNVSHFLQ